MTLLPSGGFYSQGLNLRLWVNPNQEVRAERSGSVLIVTASLPVAVFTQAEVEALRQV